MKTGTVAKSIGYVLSFAFAIAVCGVALGVDAVEEIDQELTDTASQLSRELDRATEQIHESERLGTSSSVANQYGSAGEIDSEISKTVDQANEELRRAAKRDDYTEKRRELETTRGLYYPGTKEYDQFTSEIQRLDDDFNQSVNNAVRP